MTAKLRCKNAPPVHFMQGEEDTCVFSSLASAFYSTGLQDLVRVSIVLHEKSQRHAGGIHHPNAAKQIVTKHVKWLTTQWLPKTFNWENDMNDYMFVLGVIQDTTNTCQHAVTIFRKWIFDSNEPFALPLSQEMLDCCTWDMEDGNIHDHSSFVS